MQKSEALRASLSSVCVNKWEFFLFGSKAENTHIVGARKPSGKK